jgi:DNA-binding CsgD family transcriptional regulator
LTIATDSARWRPRLIGRAAEVQTLGGALDQLASGRGVTIEVTGDPGIGKTRLLSEFAEQAEGRGFEVLRGNATEFERDLPFGVFVQALADRYRRSEPAMPGPEAAQLSALVTGRGTPGSGAERFRAYAAVRELLAGWSRTGLILVLDDMHWADPGAIELAEYLVRRPPDAPLMLVIAQRGRQAPARLAGTLAHGVELGGVVRIELGPLPPADLAELAGPGLDDQALQDVCAESAGNPLYLLAAAATRRAGTQATGICPPESAGLTAVPSVVRSRGPDGPGSSGGGRPLTGTSVTGPAPSALEAVLLAELAPLTPLEATVAAAGAVIGEQFSIDALAPVAGLSRQQVATAVGALTRRDILRQTATSPATLVFRHPVLRGVVYQSAEPAWLAAAHRRALAELTRSGAPAAELAHHVAAASGGQLSGDLQILVSAASGAMSSAPGTAAHWLKVALELIPDDAAHAQQRLDILLMLTRALGVAGRLAESRELMHEILRLVPLRPAGPRVAAVAFCARMERLLARYPEARALLEGELGSSRAAESAEGVSLAIEYGAVAILSSDFPSARSVMLAAAERARRRGDRLRHTYALASTGLGEAYEGNIQQSQRAVDAAGALADTLADSEHSREPECIAVLGWAELFLERYADAARHFARGVAISRHSGQYHVLPHLLLGQCMLACWRGPLDRAITLSEEAEEIARHIDSRDVLGFALGLRALALSWAGGADSAKRAADLAEQATAVIPQESTWWARTVATFRAAALLMGGDPGRCLHAMTALGGNGLSLLQPSIRPIYLDMLTAASVMSGDIAMAREWSQRADAEARRLGLPGQRGYALRSRGYLLAATGRHDRAAACLSAAADLLGSAGMVVGQAWALAMGAPSAAAAGRREAAMAMAADARRLAQQAASETIRATADATLQRLAAQPAAPDLADPLASLTIRERQIARLAATGLTSRDIAAELSVSPRTVDTHLSRIYRKLGITSRAALASQVAAAAQPPTRGM